jgi:hypothetical protein
MAATASNTQLPGTALLYHGQPGAGLTRYDRTDAMAYPICCKYPHHPPADGPSNVKGSARHCFGFNDTVWAALLLPWSRVRCLRLMDAASTGSITTMHKHSESRCNHTHCTRIHSSKHTLNTMSHAITPANHILPTWCHRQPDIPSLPAELSR